MLATRLRRARGLAAARSCCSRRSAQRPERRRALGFAHLTKPVQGDGPAAPRVARALGAAQQRAAAPRAHGSPAAAPPLRVLLAEDNVVNQKVATLLLERSVSSRRWSTTASEAVEAVRHERFDVVLMDVQMPVMDGLQATRRDPGLGARRPAAPDRRNDGERAASRTARRAWPPAWTTTWPSRSGTTT